LPKSDNPGRIAENIAVYGFEIEEADMERLDDLDQGDAGAIGEFFGGGLRIALFSSALVTKTYMLKICKPVIAVSNT